MKRQSQQSLWQIVQNLLSHHQKQNDLTPADALNRLLREHLERVGISPKPEINPATCPVRIEKWNTTDIGRLKTWHTRAKPRCEADPIVAVNHAGQIYVVDGSNRLNKWRDEPGMRNFEIVIISTST